MVWMDVWTMVDCVTHNYVIFSQIACVNGQHIICLVHEYKPTHEFVQLLSYYDLSHPFAIHRVSNCNSCLQPVQPAGNKGWVGNEVGSVETSPDKEAGIDSQMLLLALECR